jgi:hypothetical protein
LIAALALAYGGARVRASHRPEPRLADDPTVRQDVVTVTAEAPRRVTRDPDATQRMRSPRAALSREDAEQLSFELPDDAKSDPFGEL